MSLKELRNRIQSIKQTQKITLAMKLVASTRLHRLQEALFHSRDYLHRLNIVRNSLGRIVQDMDSNNPWLKTDGKEDLLIIFGVDQGLCGSFYNNLLRQIYKSMDDFPKAKLLVFGKKVAHLLAKKEEGRFFNFALDEKERPSFRTFLNLTTHLEQAKKSRELGSIHVVNAHFKNVLMQEIFTKQLCPFVLKPLQDRSIFEPCPDMFLSSFFHQYVSVFLYQSWLETHTSEVASRMIAMDNATRSAKDMIDNLHLKYNRTRQAKITTELIEIISGSQGVA